MSNCNKHEEELFEVENHEEKKKNLKKPEKRFICKTCSYKTNHKSSMTRHEVMHTGAKPYKCDICSYTCSYPTQLKRHKANHHRNSKYICELCGIKPPNYNAALRHYKYTHGGVSLAYWPKPLDDTADNVIDAEAGIYDENELSKQSTIHDQNPEDSFEKEDLDCSKLSQLTEEMKSTNGKHEEELFEVENYQDKKKNLTKKQKKPEKRFNCKTCPYKADHKSDMTRHEVIHTGAKPYKCDACSYACSFSSQLKRHKVSHHRDSKYSCELCGIKPPNYNAAIRHYKYQHGVNSPELN